MSSDVWEIDAVHQYLREETSLLQNIMLMMYLRGGQAPRTTEFLSIECYNGSSTSRCIYVHSGSIVYVTRHSKARRMTNQELQDARYLSYLKKIPPLWQRTLRSSGHLLTCSTEYVLAMIRSDA
jgi:hypothetical protein